MSNRNTNNKLNPNVEVVLPAGGSNPTVTSGTVSTGNTKQDLKNQISTLKTQQKETAKNIKAAQKELSKLSKPVAKKDIQIVKKKNSKNKPNGKK